MHVRRRLPAARPGRSARRCSTAPWLCGRAGSASLHSRMGWLTGGFHRLGRRQPAGLPTYTSNGTDIIVFSTVRNWLFKTMYSTRALGCG
jgi:hypothetical protein